MDKASEIRKGEELDWKNLEPYLREKIPELTGDFQVQQFHGGHANLTYLLLFGDKELVLRRPPFGKLAPGTHSMKREYRVLSELYKYFPPAPRAYHYCPDDKIIGADFILMERKKGVVVRRKMPECFLEIPDAYDRVSKAMIKAQVDLHLIDVEEKGLSHLGKPEGFLERQLEGWQQRWNHAKTEENKTMDKIFELLGHQFPIPQRVSIIHNDIKPDNCQFQPDNPDQVTAIFDWDMTTLGDPLVDFSSTLSFWPDPGLKDFKNLPVILDERFPEKQKLKNWYQKSSGLDLSGLSWYECFSYMKGAIILQQLYRRYFDGETSDPRMKVFGHMANAMIELSRQKFEYGSQS
ncbi:MAG: phosphotransferase family protein [Saprospiraceae bacterium]|nr:phosphotransferase family protein [Saprospiraceae bacterium]